MDTIDVATFRQLQKDPMVRVLDVRSGGEFESAHIPGSHNVPLEIDAVLEALNAKAA
jgi:rhodanese-related sulfurtransferase